MFFRIFWEEERKVVLLCLDFRHEAAMNIFVLSFRLFSSSSVVLFPLAPLSSLFALSSSLSSLLFLSLCRSRVVFFFLSLSPLVTSLFVNLGVFGCVDCGVCVCVSTHLAFGPPRGGWVGGVRSGGVSCRTPLTRNTHTHTLAHTPNMTHTLVKGLR